MATQTNTTAVLADARARQIGPVTQAIRNIRGHDADPIDAICVGLQDYFASLGIVVDFDAPLTTSNDGAIV